MCPPVLAKGGFEKMTPQSNGRGVLSLRAADRGVLSFRAADILMTCFHQLFTAFCVFMTEIWFSLFFHVSNSKLQQLLITANAVNTNRIQREFLFNNCIQSQNLSSASKHPRQKTNFLKQISALLSILERGWGRFRAADTMTITHPTPIQQKKRREYVWLGMSERGCVRAC
jgi:hypothetical protein